MKICDRCYRAGKTVKAHETVEFKVSQQALDLCEPCFNEFMELMRPPEPKKKKKSGKTG